MKRSYCICVALVALGASVVSCGDSVAPDVLRPLEFSVRVSKRIVARGDTATLDFMIHNPASKPVRIDASCGVMQKHIFVGSSTQPAISWLGGCVGERFEDLAPGANYVERLVVTAGALVPSGTEAISLPAGAYRAHATAAELQSNTVTFELK